MSAAASGPPAGKTAKADSGQRPRVPTDDSAVASTCFEVYKSHWNQAFAILDQSDPVNVPSTQAKQLTLNDLDTVSHYLDQMWILLTTEEQPSDGKEGQILGFTLSDNIFEVIDRWSKRTGDVEQAALVYLLQMYEYLMSNSQQKLLRHMPITHPLLGTLQRSGAILDATSMNQSSTYDLESPLVRLLHQLCVAITADSSLLPMFFTLTSDHGPARFLVLSLLIPFIHRDGGIGQGARDALLLIMALSAQNPDIGEYVADTNFSIVLAAGLSGLYSELPQKLVVRSEEWYALTPEDCRNIPELAHFLNSLAFCNAVVQVAHHDVREQLLDNIYRGFLKSVLGTALHQNSMEEIITATAYLDLFLRSITEPALLKTFLRFVLTETYDEIIILDSLITRICSNSRLCMVSLSLFQTLIDLNCEEVMFQLVFRYLIPCSHVMQSQRRAIKEPDVYSNTAERFLSLIPGCCLPRNTDTQGGEGASSSLPAAPGGNGLEPMSTAFL